MALWFKTKFKGGISEGSKDGYEGSFQDGLALDYMSDPDKLGVSKRLTKDSGSTVTDLPLWHAEYLQNDYFYGNTGKIYRRNASATWSNPKTVSSSVGNGMEVFNDELWYASNTGIGKATGIDGVTPVFYDDYFKSLSSDAMLYNETGYAGSNTYTLETSINEGSTHKYTFTATLDNARGVVIHVISKGTGDITATLHTSGNVAVASKTIATASIANGVNIFEFDGAYPVTVGASYHVHITVSTGTTTIKTSTSSDHETAAITILTDQNSADVDQSLAIGTFSNSNSYTLPTVVTEGATNRQDFVPDKEMLAGVSVMINAFSATNLTLTLVVHDANHNVVGTASALTSTLERSAVYNKFEFSTPLKLTIGATYHIHFYTSSGTVTVWTSSNNDFNTVYFKTHTTVLVSTTYHMMKTFSNLLCIGNGNYLATVDDSEVFEPERIKFPIGEKVRSIEEIGGFLGITTTRGTNIGDYSDSRLYLWDGVSEVYNDYVPLDGQGNAMINDFNKMFIVHGTQGILSYYTGAVTKARQLKNAIGNITLEVLPGAIGNWEGVIYFGLANVSDNSVITCVYSYGRKDKDYPMSLNKPFVISTGTKTNAVKIGLVKGISASKFFVGWQDGSTYGVDIIDNTKKQAYSEYTTERFDDDFPNLQKRFKSFSVRFPVLLVNEKITVKYKFNNTGSFTTLGTVDYDNNTDDRDITYKSFSGAEINNTNFFEAEFQIIRENSGSSGTMPDILSFQMEYEREPQIQIGRA